MESRHRPAFGALARNEDGQAATAGGWRYTAGMSEEPEPTGRYAIEIERVVRLLHQAAKSRGVSIRSMEKEAGVGDSVFQKVLVGKVSPSLRHILMMCDAMGLSWQEFFAEAYAPPPSAEPSFDDRVRAILYSEGLLPLRPAAAPGEAEAEEGETGTAAAER